MKSKTFCVPCHWVGSDSWRPCECVMSSVWSSQPCSGPLDSRLCLLLWSPSISQLDFFVSWCLLCFPALLPFPKNLAWWCACSRTASVLSFFASSKVSGLICIRTHLFIFLVVPSIRTALLQHHISKTCLVKITLRTPSLTILSHFM